MRHESRVRGLAFMEAILGPVPSWEQFTPQGREIFKKLRTPGVGETMVLDHNMFVEQLLPGSVVRSLSPAELQHYRAPFVERRAQADAGVAVRDSDRRRARGCRHGRVALSRRLVPVAAAKAAVHRRAGHARAGAVGGVVPCEPTKARRHRARARIALRATRSSARDRRAPRGLGAPHARGLNAIARRCRSVEEEEIMAQQKFLVTGATGDAGGYTGEQLLERGHAVRALAHREDDRSKRLGKMGAEVVIGDFLKFNDVRAAMRGVRGAYFCYPIRPGILQATAYFAQAAKEASLECVVTMSQWNSRPSAKSQAMCDHWLAERVFDWSGLTVAHLRPTLFAEWLLYLAPMIRAGLLHVPFGPGRHAPIAAEDQARVIVGILEDPASHRC